MIQEQVINKIIQTRDSSIIVLNALTEEYFSDHIAEFRYITEHLKQYGNVPDAATFFSKFEDFPNIQVTESDSYLLAELSEDRNKRFIKENFEIIRQAFNKGDTEGALRLLRQAAENSIKNTAFSCEDIIHDTDNRYAEYLDKCQNQSKYFVPTGFRELDALLQGWNTKDDVVTIVARNGVGKTWVLLKCASAAVEAGLNAGIYSGEMSANSVAYRVDTLMGHISNGALVHGGASVKNQYKEYLENLGSRITGTLRILTPKDLGGPATVSKLRAFVEKYNLDVLFIDQHSLLEDERHGATPPQQAANISTDIKILQSVKEIPVVAVCQQNREDAEEADGFSTKQLAGSDKIGQDSSIIIFVERVDDLFKLHLKKAREAGCGQVLTYRIDLNTGSFTFIPDEKTDKRILEAQDQTQTFSDDEVF